MYQLHCKMKSSTVAAAAAAYFALVVRLNFQRQTGTEKSRVVKHIIQKWQT